MSAVVITEADWQCAADLASLSERICFGGNDAAALRNMVAGDESIEEFVRVVAGHRVAAIEQAADLADAKAVAWFEQSKLFQGFAADVIGNAIRALCKDTPA